MIKKGDERKDLRTLEAWNLRNINQLGLPTLMR